jgi:localization factor PodJL
MAQPPLPAATAPTADFAAALTVFSPRAQKYATWRLHRPKALKIDTTSATVATMNGAAAWNLRGLARETRAFAEEAARRAGMSLGDWLDEAVADKAAEQGVEPGDLEPDDRLDAIGERISRLSRRDDQSGEDLRPPARGEPRARRDDPGASQDEARRADESLEAAIARLESRAERREARAMRALDSVARWIERSQADRGEQRAALQAVVEKLDAINQRAPRESSRPAAAPARRESRLDEIERPRIDVREAVSQIARRRSELDARATPPDLEASKRGSRNFGADPASSSRPSPAAPQAEQAPRPSPSPPVEAGAAAPAHGPSPTDALRGEMLALSLRLDQMRRQQSEQSARPPLDVQGLRAEIAAMSRSLADLAPRNAVVALEGAMRDLSERVASMRDNGARETLVAPVEALVDQVLDALRAHDPHAAVQGLEREIRAIDAKVDAIAQGVVNPAAFERIRSQTEEVRNLLAAAAMRPVPVERLEKQIADLADRVERLALSPAPQAESERVVALLADARAQIERSTPAAALSAIERRLEQLAQRMDQALQRPQPAPGVESGAVEDLARRIDAVRAAIERQNGARPDAAKLEAALRDISQKLDRPTVAAANPDALAAMFQDLAARIDRRVSPTIDIKPIEQALRSLGDRPVEIDTTPIENMVRDLGARFVAPTAPDLRPLESLLRDINQKLDRGATSASPPDEIAAMIRDLGARFVAPTAPDLRPLESLLRDINQKLDRGATSASPPDEIAAMIRDLGAHIDQRVGPPIDIHPLEEALRALNDRLELGAASQLDPKFVEQAADLFAERLGRREGASVDADALASQISEIHDRLDALQPDAASKAALDQHVIADLIAELDATRRALQPPAATDAFSTAALDQRVIADLIAELDATRKTLQSLPELAARDNDDVADGLADLRAEQASADKRTQARLANLQDTLERLVNRLGRVDEGAGAQPLGAANAAQKVAPAGAGEASNATDAALRDIPDRAAARDGPGEPAWSGKPGQAGQAPPLRSLDGSDFLLEPGASLVRARASESAEFATPKSAINAHIAAARRAAQAALTESAAKEGKPRQAAESADAGERARGSAGGRAKAFFAARRRPILLGAALLAAIATFAVVELRGARHAPMQKSELQAPAQRTASPDIPRLAALSGAAAVDPHPIGSIAAPPTPAKSAKSAPAGLAASIPAGLPPALREAAAAGDAAAELELALRLIDGRGVAKDPSAAAQWFEQAAVQDLPLAQYRLAALYEKGLGVARDSALAMSWYTKAATAGNARAMHNLAVMNAEGAAGGKPDYSEAAQWFRKAGQLGIRDSQFNLGVLYARGMGVPQDLVQSWLWFSLAAQQGDADAAKKRDEVAAKMDAGAAATAARALAEFKTSTPSPAANEAPAPAGGWEAKTGAPQASPTPAGASAL